MTLHWQRHRYRFRGHRPPPFVRRMGCAFAMLLVLAAIGGMSLVSLFHNRFLSIAAGFGILVALTSGLRFALRRTTAVFRAQDAQRRQLMADVAHELRTPLAILQGRVEGLIDGVYPRDDAHLEQLLDEIGHLTRLVEDLRTIANAEAGALELRKEEVDLAELIRDVAGSFERRIDVDAPDELMMEVDPVRMREVLLNLLTNAVRHSEEAIAIRVDAGSKQVTLRVIDRGAGIPADQLPRIFDRFHKSADSRGSGLGLAIARNLVLAHGGTIRAESTVGVGTTVTVILPR